MSDYISIFYKATGCVNFLGSEACFIPFEGCCECLFKRSCLFFRDGRGGGTSSFMERISKLDIVGLWVFLIKSC